MTAADYLALPLGYENEEESGNDVIQYHGIYSMSANMRVKRTQHVMGHQAHHDALHLFFRGCLWFHQVFLSVLEVATFACA